MDGLVAIEIQARAGNLCVVYARPEYCGDAGSSEVRAGRKRIVTASPTTLARDEPQQVKLAEFLRAASAPSHVRGDSSVQIGPMFNTFLGNAGKLSGP
ncbi:hypothetical protein OKW38_002977 [Paraburkholderia sp. MM5496-R1]